MIKLQFAAILAAGAMLALTPAQAAAQETANPVSLGLKMEVKSDGPEVVEMLPDRTGAALGFQIGDILLEAGGKPISLEVLQDYLKQAKAGDTVTFKVNRSGAPVELTGKAIAAPQGAPAPAPQTGG